MSSRALRTVVLLLLLGTSFVAGQPAERPRPAAAADELLLYVGTYTRGTSKGVYALRLDRRTGRLSEPTLAAEISNPSFLASDPTKRVLYAVTESPAAPARGTAGAAGAPNVAGATAVAGTAGATRAAGATGGSPAPRPPGTVTSFAIGDDGSLTRLSEQTTGGAGPAYVSVDRTGSALFVANYGGGSVAMLPIEKDGRLRAASAVVQHEGSSVHPTRQQRPHAHSINPDPSNQYALAADLGIDRILVYRFDGQTATVTGTLTATLTGTPSGAARAGAGPESAAGAGAGAAAPRAPAGVKVEPGSGPRHLAFHPNGRAAYVTNEMTSSLSVFAWDAARGALAHVQTISTLPEASATAPAFTGTNSAADVQVHPSGRFVFGSNRGHDSIATFAVDEPSGRLRLVGHQPTGGKRPRHFGIDPSGAYLLAANQDSDSVVVFRIDERTGQLTPTGSRVDLGSPVCVRFVNAKGNR